MVDQFHRLPKRSEPDEMSDVDVERVREQSRIDELVHQSDGRSAGN